MASQQRRHRRLMRRKEVPPRVVERFDSKVTEFSEKTLQQLEELSRQPMSRTDKTAMLTVVQKKLYKIEEKHESGNNGDDQAQGSDTGIPESGTDKA